MYGIASAAFICCAAWMAFPDANNVNEWKLERAAIPLDCALTLFFLMGTPTRSLRVWGLSLCVSTLTVGYFLKPEIMIFAALYPAGIVISWFSEAARTHKLVRSSAFSHTFMQTFQLTPETEARFMDLKE
jgi:hypothetical protein